MTEADSCKAGLWRQWMMSTVYKSNAAVFAGTVAFATALLVSGLAFARAPLNERQAPPAPNRRPVVRIEVRGPVAQAATGEFLSGSQAPQQRDIVDSWLGNRWRFISDEQHPEWPDRLVLVSSRVPLARVSSSPPALPQSQNDQPAAALVPPNPPLIRAGDRVTVLQETALVRARLQAVALESAVVGQTMRVRLLGGIDTHTGNQGTIVIVRADSADRVTWLAVEGNR